MTDPKGLLLVMVDPAPMLEEELNDWYDTEHLPERQAIPGFETAGRFTSLGDGPRYIAIYDLTSLDVLQSDAYRAVSGDNFSPWTRRVTSRSHPIRITAHQIHPGDRTTGICARLMLLRWRNVAEQELCEMVKALEQSFASCAGLLQWRLFRCQEPDPSSVLVLADFASVVSGPDAFAAPIASKVDLAATYRPYRA